MGKLEDLSDWSMFDGSIPCVKCKSESAKTLLGDHWKCSKCDHIFNEDGSDPGVQCLCDQCRELAKAAHAEEQAKKLEELNKVLKQLKGKKKKKKKSE